MSFEERLHPRGRGGKFTTEHGAGKINVRSRSRNGDEVAQSVRPDELSKGSAGEQRVVADMKAKFPGAKQIDWFGTGLNEGDRVTHTHHGQGTVVRAGTNGKATTVKFDSGETMPVLNHEMVHGEHGPGSGSAGPGAAGPKDASHADLMAAKAAGHKVQLHRFDPASKSWVPEGEPTTPDTAIAKAQAAMAAKHVVRLEVRKPGAAEPTGPMRHATGMRHKTEAIRSMRRQA